jgi:tetratricopeptide (TPR) repeat protein
MLLRTIFLSFIFLLLFTVDSYTQGKSHPSKPIWEDESVDEGRRFKALDDFYSEVMQEHPDSALLVLKYHLDLAIAQKNDREMFRAWRHMGKVMFLKQDYQQAMTFYEKAERIAERLNDSALLAKSHGSFGAVHLIQKDYISATRRYTKALTFYQQLGDVDGENTILANLGSVFLSIRFYERALEYYSKVLESLLKRKSKDRNIAIVYMNMGMSFYGEKRFELAREYYEKGLDILQREKSLFYVARSYSILALICNELKEREKALEYAQKSQMLYHQLGVRKGILEAKITEADIVFNQSPETAFKNTRPLLQEIRLTDDNLLKKRLYEILYKYYKYVNLPSEALAMHEHYMAYADSVVQETNQFNIIQETFKRESEFQIMQNELKSQQEKQRLIARHFQKTTILITIFFIVVGILLHILHRNNSRNKLKRAVLLQEIEQLKKPEKKELLIDKESASLNRALIEKYINRNLNETDWKVLNILLDSPSISNAEIANRAFLSVDGIGSSLRRMYDYFDLKETKYRKIALIIKAMNISRGQIT